MASDLEEERKCHAKLTETAASPMDKKMVIDARDQLLRLRQDRQTDLATAVALVGTCVDMCPEQERYFRIATNCVSTFEMTPEGVPDETRMVKEYRRSGADQKEPLPHELRPISVLQRTMNYLCLAIVDEDPISKGVNVGEWFDFIWSRTRSIRKDITQQHLINRESVDLIEKCARFHIFCDYYLCEEDVRDFDPKINLENLHNCLQTLKEFYFDLSTRSIFLPNEIEFRTYDILLNLQNSETLSELKHYRKEVRDSDQIRFAVKLYQAYDSKNHIKFFQFARRANFLMSCILNKYFNQFRIDIVNIMRRAYTVPKSNASVAYPLSDMVQQFAFDDWNDLSEFCSLVKLEHDNESVFLRRSHSHISATPKRSRLLVQDKLNTTPGRAILQLNTQLSIDELVLDVHSSFDQNNRLIFDKSTLTLIKAPALEETSVKPVQSTSIPQSLFEDSKILNNNINNVKFSTFNSVEKDQRKQDSLFSFSNQMVKLAPAKTNSFFNSTVPNGSLFSLPKSSPLTEDTSDEVASNNTASSFTFDLKNRTVTPNETNNFVFKPPPLVPPKPVQFSEMKQSFNNFTVSEEMKQAVFDSVLSQITIQECQMSLKREWKKRVALNSNQYFDYLLASLLNETIAKVIESAKKKNLFIVENSHKLLNFLISDVVTSSIQENYRNVQINHQRKCVNIIANQLYQQMFDWTLHGLIQEVMHSEQESRDIQIKQWRDQCLKKKYYRKWHSFYLSRKQFKFYRENFPAAPNRKIKDDDIQLLYHTPFDGSSFVKTYNDLKRQLVYSKYRNSADVNSYLKENLNKKLTLQKETSHLEQLRRFYYLEKKYFKLWLQRVRSRKLNFILAKFPAAPSSTASSVHTRQPRPNLSASRLTQCDDKVKDASAFLKRNLLQKLHYDHDSTIASVKRKLDQCEQQRLVRQSPIDGHQELSLNIFHLNSESSPKRLLSYYPQ